MMIYPLTAAGILLTAAAYVLLRRAKRALVVLTHVKIGRPPANARLKNEWTSVAQLERTLNNLARRNFTTVLPGELSKSRLPAKPVLLAFMGGYQSFYTEVFPLLQKYNAKACVFLAQEYVGAYDAWQDPYREPWQNLLTETQLKELRQSGLVEFGALDLKARDLTLLPVREAAFGAAENSFRLKKQLGLTVEAFAFWPAAKWNEKTAREMLHGLENLPVLTPVPGVNSDTKTMFLKTLDPAKNPWRTRCAVWFRR
ncbi:MAG: polysaccharide deacetylase family protein [Elusimicrobia bacterium]|nr:polysaccharide deacetylase family protein [Elusimicrobiota bacterium]MDY6039741.1 polysaccharide deacetylase family protein [Elusimicrobiaceae bacterium]